MLFYLNLFIFCHAGSSLRRRHSSSCVERRPLEPCWVGFSGCFPRGGGASQGASLLWAGLLRVLPSCGRGWWGCCPLVGRASWGAALLRVGLIGVLPSCGVVPLEVLPSCRRDCQGAAFFRGGAVGGAGFSSFRRGLGRRDFRSLERRLSSWDAQA